MRSIAIGLLGAGNVGCGVVQLLRDNHDAIARRVGASIQIKRVLLRSPGTRRPIDVPAEWKTTDPADILADPEIRVVVEVMGGLEPARQYVLEAIAAGKHVVSANKALLGTFGKELFAAAAQRGVSLHFEASVAGGIPILRSLREGLASDRIEAVSGIVNGTCNFVLDTMTRMGASFDAALAEAQVRGLAEADPALDISGVDAAQKLTLLALVAFGLRVDPQRIPTEGITRITAFDIEAARTLGCVIKSIAAARVDHGRLLARVHPALVPMHNVLGGVHGTYNAVLVESRALGRSLYYGRGAGMMPTGTAVVADLVEVCRAIIGLGDRGTGVDELAAIVDVTPASLDDERHENYVRVTVPNVPGVLGQVANCLGAHGVSIKRVNQDPRGPGLPVEMVVVTESVTDAELRAALAEIDGLPTTLAPVLRLRLLEADPLD